MAVSLTRELLQTLSVDAIAYGAKDTGEMGGGALAAVLAAAGPQLLGAVSSELATTSRNVGTVVVTEAFGLRTNGVRWIVHIVSIIKHTPQGAYCPQPERLRDGVAAALHAVSRLGARSIAISALATGEGRVAPLAAAGFMLDGVRLFSTETPDADLDVTFSLPSHRDYLAFQSLLSKKI